MLADGVYRAYNVTSDGTTLTYVTIARWMIQNGVFSILEDPAGMLQVVQEGPVTRRTEGFLHSFANGAYRHVILEQPGQEPPETYAHTL